MSAPPREPYPPDPAEDAGDAVEAVPVALREGIVDATVEGADWANVRVPRSSIRRVRLRLVRMTGAELAESTIGDVTFEECNLRLAGLREVKLERVVFRDCPMDECDFYRATLNDVLFERCTLRAATLTAARLTRVELRGCDLEGLRGVEALAGARLPFHDALQNTALFALGLGIELIDDDLGP